MASQVSCLVDRQQRTDLCPGCSTLRGLDECYDEIAGDVRRAIEYISGTLTGMKESATHFGAEKGAQVMFARMGITLVLSMLYMWWAAVPHFPFGPREVQGLLLARGFGGFFGLLGIYYSLAYLPLGEATVITFLAPIVACWACSILMHQPFTRKEQVAGFVSLLGVVLIARPTSYFSVHTGDTPIASLNTNVTAAASVDGVDKVTSAQRLTAIGVALIGVLGAACAYTTIRWIGQRAHPLISVNYFAAWTTFVATMVLLLVPGMDFKLPSGLRQWAYLIFLGLCGFIMQVMLTTGLSYEKSSRATNMIYTQMLFALAFDKLVFDSTPNVLSIVGSAFILGSALCVAIQQDPSKQFSNRQTADSEEEIGLMANDVEIDDQRRPDSAQEFQLQSRRS
ncbi:MAG: hypothetical protein LQ352_003333 [Teloschistes flavicans]|nr:MAG: hypothetical protein LQ352_003333 [Teloschistes flavicans]